jgi:hypothetical protein
MKKPEMKKETNTRETMAMKGEKITRKVTGKVRKRLMKRVMKMVMKMWVKLGMKEIMKSLQTRKNQKRMGTKRTTKIQNQRLAKKEVRLPMMKMRTKSKTLLYFEPFRIKRWEMWEVYCVESSCDLSGIWFGDLRAFLDFEDSFIDRLSPTYIFCMPTKIFFTV